MNRNTSRSFSANEKEIERLLQENRSWKEELSYISEEINFLILFLTADIFRKNVLNLYEKLQLFYNDLQEIKKENIELIREVHNHRYDIEGILECEDISCEVFYHEEHIKLGQRIQDFADNFKVLKMDIYLYTGSNLRKTSKET
ncbi:hypothetical protein SAMN06296241_2727 [Salinimicrobium sediminis]|uniref:Uncharacterized protein n=1 Tax=Salinimicrobium sediminis TaxID=1343891 RepID=A0A285X788_9FLAO|nr:hypothetical protein [Salinimicrobium sediminis]SOC81155.1 hypothetical protein SAMN06296241_2727 [Salinimicrobium sediminis]